MAISREKETRVSFCRVWMFVTNVCFFVIRKVNCTKPPSEEQCGPSPPDRSTGTSCCQRHGCSEPTQDPGVSHPVRFCFTKPLFHSSTARWPSHFFMGPPKRKTLTVSSSGHTGAGGPHTWVTRGEPPPPTEDLEKHLYTETPLPRSAVPSREHPSTFRARDFAKAFPVRCGPAWPGHVWRSSCCFGLSCPA